MSRNKENRQRQFGRNYQWSFGQFSRRVYEKEEKERKRETEKNVTSVGGSQLACHTRELILRAAFLAFSFATILSLATLA